MKCKQSMAESKKKGDETLKWTALTSDVMLVSVDVEIILQLTHSKSFNSVVQLVCIYKQSMVLSLSAHLSKHFKFRNKP